MNSDEKKKAYKCWCCFPDCRAQASKLIMGGDGPEDYTHACNQHANEMLGPHDTIQELAGAESFIPWEQRPFNDPTKEMPKLAHRGIFLAGKCQCGAEDRCNNCLFKGYINDERQEKVDIWDQMDYYSSRSTK